MLVAALPAGAGRAETAAGAPPPPAAAARARSSGIEVVVYKEQRHLAVYRAGDFVAGFPVVLGLHPAGTKRYEGDARTPEGRYRVVSTREHSRWQHFLAIDYPNDADRGRYEEALARGDIPDRDGEPAGIGHSIGIHGSDRLEDQEAGVDWTQGCVALSPADAARVASLVPAGSPVWIVK